MNIAIKVPSPFDYENTVLQLKEALKSQQFGVLWELNFKDKLEEKGLTFESNFKVMEACNPKKAEKVLKHNIEAGYFLPCKVVVYEQNNQVYMGMLSPVKLIGMIDDPELEPIALEVESALITAMNVVKDSAQ